MGSREVWILVVDDDVEVAELYELWLQEAAPGAHVVRCPDVYQGLAALRDHRFDVVVLDLLLPGAHGDALLSRVRRSDPDLPVVVVTGLAGRESTRRAVGAAAVLAKPVSRRQFCDVVLGAASPAPAS